MAAINRKAAMNNGGKALVTGGAGFIGSHLVDALCERGVETLVVDNLSSGHLANLDHRQDQIRFVKGDIRDLSLMAELMAGCGVVFHLAAVVSVPQTVDDPLGSAMVNDIGTLNVLEAARRQQVGRVVLSSSCAVYGDDPAMPKREDGALRPMSPYAVQKLAGEYNAKVFTDLFGLETVCLRYFNVFGPRQDPSSPYSGVISIFLNRAAAGRAPVIYGDGLQYRGVVFVKDVVRAKLLAAQAPQAPGQRFNIGTGRSVTINQLWQAVAGLAGVSRPPDYLTPRPGDIRESVADISQATSLLGFSPEFAFEQGLEITYQWYRSNKVEA